MKTITFEGKQYEVPEWVNWVSKDEDGEISGYESMPHVRGDIWVLGGKMYQIELGDKEWRESLTKV